MNTINSNQPIRFGASRDIDLVSLIPNNLKESEMLDFVQFFQDYLNTLFDGSDGYTMSETVTGQSATIQYIDPANIGDQKISILEKVERLADMHDPNLIDLEYLQYFANNMGYKIDINRGEIGNFFVDSIACSAVDSEKYLRFVIENLPNWYKIKTTRNAIKVMLYSFGLIGDIAYYYTDNYLPKSQGGVWNSPDYTMSGDNINLVPKSYYPTPHFIVWTDIDQSSTSLSWDYSKRQQIINAIESIRPINTIFRHLGGYLKRVYDIYVEMMIRYNRYLKIPSNGNSDYWV